MSGRRGNKYRNIPTVIDGIRFASKKEAARWQELKLLERAGLIRDVKRQPWFVLMAPVTKGATLQLNERQPNGWRAIGNYVADFFYQELQPRVRWVVEDVKSPATRKDKTYAWKKRHFEAQYDIEITEI